MKLRTENNTVITIRPLRILWIIGMVALAWYFGDFGAATAAFMVSWDLEWR